MRRPVVLLTTALLAAGLTACSGSGSTGAAAKSASIAVAQAAEATGAADPKGGCDKTGFQSHAGLAIGSVDTYLWKPLQAGAFADGAKDRAAAMKNAAGASALVAKELTAAGPLVSGCPGSIILVNAMATGSSLAKAANGQLAKGTLNKGTIAGVNSIAGTLSAQAAKLGITVKPTTPTAAQVAAG